MKIRFVGTRARVCATLSVCGAIAALMCSELHATSQDTGQGSSSPLLESTIPVALYPSPSGAAKVDTAPAEAFPLKSDGKVEKRYKVHYKGGTYYVDPLDVHVRQQAKVVCAKAPSKTVASRFGAGSDECNK
jgi:hypothetical protein